MTPVLDNPAGYSALDRTATIRNERTWLSTPQDWALRIRGEAVGGYGFIDHLDRSIPTARFATQEDAERVAAVWIETGLTPAFQTPERIAAARLEQAA